MTDQLSELVEKRRQELAELEAERLKAQDEAQQDQNSLAQLDELEKLERQIAVEKSARDRAAAVRRTIQKRLESRLGNQSSLPAQTQEGSAE